MILFEDDEEAYRQWVETHPSGFVVNSYRNPTADYLVLHRATCKSISSEKISNYTTTGYIKTCSDDLRELRQWAAILQGQLKETHHCLVGVPQ